MKRLPTVSSLHIAAPVAHAGVLRLRFPNSQRFAPEANGLPVGLLAAMGFVAVFAGASNTPLASSIMAIELFGIACSPYVAIACIVAYLISGHHGIYSSQVIGDAKTATKLRETGSTLGEV